MIILTNALSKRDDEGSLKVARNLIMECRRKAPDTKIFTYGDQPLLTDEHFDVNKLMLNAGLAKKLFRSGDTVLYAPLYARILPTSVRIFVLSLYTRRKLKVLLPMLPKLSRLGLWLIRLSGAELMVLSQKSEKILQEALPNRIHYLKAAVDTERFVPVCDEQKAALRRKYGIPENKPVVLHIGHMKYGRNLDKLLLIDERFHVVLVTSTTTAAFADEELEKALRRKENLTIIDTYLPNVEEIYQLSDIYFFPVVNERNCIDVPLSAFEAASCGIPVVATAYGEMQQMAGKEGFWLLSGFEKETINGLLSDAVSQRKNARNSVLEYDWKRAVNQLIE